jgi:NodT family efflux transporter outer membrane factor (OMF) lipoprotein
MSRAGTLVAVLARVLTMGVTIAVASGLTGCAVGPDAETPMVDAPEAWRAAASDPERGPAPESRWWDAFGDGTLSELVEETMAQSLELGAARARVVEARALRRAAGAALLPQLGTSAVGRRSGLSETGGSTGSEFAEFGVLNDPVEFYQASFDASWELDVFGGNRRREQAATARWLSAHARLGAERLRLTAEVARAYLELRGAQQRRDVLGDIVVERRRLLELTRSRTSAGLAPIAEIRGPERALADARSGIERLDAAIAVRIHRLSVLTGRLPASLYERLDGPSPLPAVPPVADGGIPADLIGRRPDLIAAEQRLRAAAAEVGVAVARLYPTVALFGQAGRESDTAADLLESASEIWTLGLSLSWPIFEGGRLRAEVDAAEARLEQARFEFRDAALRAFEDVESQFAVHRADRRRTGHRRNAARAAEDALDSADARRQSGLIDRRATVAARLDALAAEQQRIEAHTDALVSFVGIYKALGGGWRPSDLKSGAAAKQRSRDAARSW